MNTITLDTIRLSYSTFAKFENARNILHNHNVRYMSYYDRHGDNHVCTFKVNGNCLECLGKKTNINASENNFHKIAGDIVKEERWDEFCGWSL